MNDLPLPGDQERKLSAGEPDLESEIQRIMQLPGMYSETRTLLQMALESVRASQPTTQEPK